MKNCSTNSPVNVMESRVFTGLGKISGCDITVDANLQQKRAFSDPGRGKASDEFERNHYT